jgi:hypothetical protein
MQICEGDQDQHGDQSNKEKKQDEPPMYLSQMVVRHTQGSHKRLLRKDLKMM